MTPAERRVLSWTGRMICERFNMTGADCDDRYNATSVPQLCGPCSARALLRAAGLTELEPDELGYIKTVCDLCGCTPENACEGGCSWAIGGEPDSGDPFNICSACAPPAKSQIVVVGR